jgi:hypothetical protein
MTEVVVGQGEVTSQEHGVRIWVFPVEVNGRVGLFTVGGRPNESESFLREHVKNYLTAHPDEVEGIVSTNPSGSGGVPTSSEEGGDENNDTDTDDDDDNAEDDDSGENEDDGAEDEGGDDSEEDGDSGDDDSGDEQESGTDEREGDGLGEGDSRLEELMATAIARRLLSGELTVEEEVFDTGGESERQRQILTELAAKVASGEIILELNQPAYGEGLGNDFARANHVAVGILLARKLAELRDPFRQDENDPAAEGYDDVPGRRGPRPNWQG